MLLTLICCLYNDAMDKKTAFIGLGVMGKSMASRLIDAGYELYIYNRTKAKGGDLVAKGAIWCNTPEEAARNASVIFTIVGYPKDVENIYLGKDGLIEAAEDGKIFCDMTTTKPSLEVMIDSKLREKGAAFADAPVSGGDRGAREGTLSIMCGTDDDTFNALLPYFYVMGKNIVHMGPAGSGQHTKMANQIVIAGTMAGVSEALVYGARAGLDPEKLVATIGKGAAGCWTLDNLAPRVIKGDFAPGFMVDHFIKDMSIALSEADEMGLSLPSLALTRELYKAVSAEGHGKDGTQVLIKALERLSGKDEG